MTQFFVLLATTVSLSHVFAATTPSRGVFAHRGASSSHPENTLAGIREAIRLGAQGVEIDIHRTKDGHLVLMHDSTVDRTTNGSGSIDQMTLSEIKSLDAGSWKSPAFRGEQVPTLEEALAILPPSMWVNLDVKDSDLAIDVARVVSRLGMQSHVMIGCAKGSIKAVHAVDPTLKTVNMSRELFNSTYVKNSIKYGASFLQFKDYWPVPSIQEIQTAAKAGVQSNYCCSDEPKTIQKLFNRGVNFILMNDVEVGLEVLKAQQPQP